MSRIKKTDENKPWARREITRNEIKIRQAKNIFLIYCEGENTEPEYFKSFPVNTETLVEAVGLGRSRTALVQHIIELAGKQGFLRGQPNYDPDRRIWCVFDKDERGIAGENEDFDGAIFLALDHELHVAYSNDSFELWFFLHDHYVDTRLLRTHFYDHLSKRLGLNYAEDGKSKDFARSLYSIYLDRQPQAIRHAQRLLDLHNPEPIPSRRNPCTTVHLLVLELNTCLKP